MMTRILIGSLVLLLILGINTARSGVTASDYPYDAQPGNFPLEDDWFGRKGVTRRQLEQEKQKKETEALKKDAEKRDEVIRAKAEGKNLSTTINPNRMDRIRIQVLKEENEALRSAIKGSLAINAEAQNTRSGMTSDSDWPKRKGKKSPPLDSTVSEENEKTSRPNPDLSGNQTETDSDSNP